MTQPHHHVFNALQGEINRLVKIKPLLPLLLERRVFKPTEYPFFDSENGMKVLTGYLRSQDYDTFLRFISCICDHPTEGSKYLSIVRSVRDVVKDFDERFNSSYATQVDEIIKQHEKVDTFSLPPLLSEISSMSLEEKTPPGLIHNLPEEHLSLPHLSFLEEPLNFTLNKDNNYTFTEFEKEYGFKIEGLPGLENVTFKLGLFTHGPFAIPDIYKVVTCFVCITASTKLTHPIRITMQHCLLMPVYQQSSSVLILHADHTIMSTDDSYMFSAHFDCGEGGRKKTKIYPLISTTDSTLSFEIQDLCILCGVLEEETVSTSTTYESTTSNESTNEKTDSFDPKATSSKELTNERTGSFGPTSPVVAKQASLEEPAQQDEGRVKDKDKILSSPRRARFKRQHSDDEEKNKRNCKTMIEYTLLLVEPICKRKTFSIFIFVLENCFTSLKECLRQGKQLCMTDNISKNVINGTFTDSNIYFTVLNDNLDWTVDCKKSVHSISEREFHQQKATVKFYAKENLFPPRMEFIISSKEPIMTSDLIFEISISGFEPSDYSTTSHSDAGVSFKIFATPPPSDYIHPPVPTNLRHHFNSLSSRFRQSVISDKGFLLKFYQEIRDWKRLGRSFGIPGYDLEAIESNNPIPGRHQLEYEMLLKWWDTSVKTQRTLDFVANALIQADESAAFKSFIDNCQ